MNNLDKQYTDLLQDILDNGVSKKDRTGTGTISVFGRQIRHKMSEGFPLITTKKMPFKTITTELLWFLRGDTNIKFLVDNNCHIWDGDAYKNYIYNPDYKSENYSDLISSQAGQLVKCQTQEDFINKIKTDDEFAKKWGDLGPVYGKQWRSWNRNATRDEKIVDPGVYTKQIDQIQNLINDLKTNPDSRRLIVSAWNPADLPHQVLPPCHYGFQVYTRELSASERITYKNSKQINLSDSNELFDFIKSNVSMDLDNAVHKECDEFNIPTRAISLMFNMRSVDTFLGLPFNIASYGLLLEIIAKSVNMVPDELIGNLGDVHLYSNHVEQAKEQIGRELDLDERREMVTQEMFNQIYNAGDSNTLSHSEIDQWNVPTRTREPYTLPTLNINTEFWSTESGECGIGLLDAIKIFNSFTNDNFCKCLLEEDIQLSNYRSHEKIKAPLSN
jgi:thymidylate synthase